MQRLTPPPFRLKHLFIHLKSLFFENRKRAKELRNQKRLSELKERGRVSREAGPSYWGKLRFPRHENVSLLEERVKHIAQVNLTPEQRKKLWERIHNRMEAPLPRAPFYVTFVQKLQKLALEIKPSASFRTHLAIRLRTLAVSHREHFSFRFFFRKQIWTLAVLFFFVTTLFFNFGFRVPRVEASKATVIESLDGEVLVIRNAKTFTATLGFSLKTDDIIKTGPNSKVSIRFLDDSMSRLGENTEIQIEKLFMNPANKAETVVEVALRRGRLWTRVVNLINDASRFEVKTANTRAVAKKKAAFDVNVSKPGKAKITTMSNSVDVVLMNNKKVVSTTVVNGFETQVEGKAIPKTTKTEPEKESWVVTNLEEDQKYIEHIVLQGKEERRQKHATETASPLGSVFTFDEFERQKKLLKSAEQKLTEAEMLLEGGKTDEAKTRLWEFREILTALGTTIRTWEVTVPEKSIELKVTVASTLAFYRKQFSVFLPDHSLYLLKQAVLDAEVLIATDTAERADKQLQQASDHLLEAGDLSEKGQFNLAQEKIHEFNEAVFQTVSEVKSLPDEKKEKAVGVILDSKVQNLKVLEAIGQTAAAIPSEPILETVIPLSGTSSDPIVLQEMPQALPQDLKQTVNEVKKDTLINMGEAVLSVSGNSGVDMLEKIDTLRKIDVNGKQVVDMKVEKGQVMIGGNFSDVSSIAPLRTERTEEGKIIVEEVKKLPGPGNAVIIVTELPPQSGTTTVPTTPPFQTQPNLESPELPQTQP